MPQMYLIKYEAWPRPNLKPSEVVYNEAPHAEIDAYIYCDSPNQAMGFAHERILDWGWSAGEREELNIVERPELPPDDQRYFDEALRDGSSFVFHCDIDPDETPARIFVLMHHAVPLSDNSSDGAAGAYVIAYVRAQSESDADRQVTDLIAKQNWRADELCKIDAVRRDELNEACQPRFDEAMERGASYSFISYGAEDDPEPDRRDEE